MITVTTTRTMDYTAILGRVIQYLRTERGLDQTTVAQAIGVSQATFSRLENGQVPITVRELHALSVYFDVKPRWFLYTADAIVRANRDGASP